MSAPTPDAARLEALSGKLKAAAEEYPAVDAVVVRRPDWRDEELKREARRIFIPPPDPRVSALQAELDKRRGEDGSVTMDDELLALLNGPYAGVDENADRLK